jgi:four helix bundle protein
MLVGLRRAWGAGGWDLREDLPSYSPELATLFPHESLHVYQTSLDFLRWFHALPGGAELSSRLYRQVDKSATSVVLNIAEANCRFLQADRRRFHDLAEASAVKAAACVDLCVRKGELAPMEREQGVQLLCRTALMLRGLSLV